MRLRVLPLGQVAVGSAIKTNFAIVVDRLGDFEWPDEAAEAIKEATGATGVLVFDDTEVELDTNAVEVDENLVQSVLSEQS